MPYRKSKELWTARYGRKKGRTMWVNVIPFETRRYICSIWPTYFKLGPRAYTGGKVFVGLLGKHILATFEENGKVKHAKTRKVWNHTPYSCKITSNKRNHRKLIWDKKGIGAWEWEWDLGHVDKSCSRRFNKIKFLMKTRKYLLGMERQINRWQYQLVPS